MHINQICFLHSLYASVLTISLLSLLPHDIASSLSTSPFITRTIPMLMKRRGVETRLIMDDGRAPIAKSDSKLIKVIAKAYAWFDDLVSGGSASIREIAQKAGVTDGYISIVLPLAFLAPDIMGAIIEGNHPADLTADKLLKHIDLPLDWNEQRRVLGFNES